MRLIVVLFALVCSLTLGQNTADYKVVRVIGKVENQSQKKEIKTGDIITAKDKLIFGNFSDYIIIMSPHTGRMKISGVPDKSSRELLDLLKSFVQPELRSTATRNIALRYLEKLQGSLAFDTLLILGDGFVPINTEQLSLAKPAVIRAWYTEYRKVVYKPVSTDHGFKLDRKTLFGDTPPSVLPKIVIEYFEDEKDEPMFSPGYLLAAFIPLYVDELALAEELRVIIGLHKTSSPEARVNEVRAYLASEYANPQEDNLKAWLKQQGLISE